MRRFVLVIAMLVGCGGDDSGSEPLRWSWSFVDPQTHADVGCPANVSKIRLVAYQDVMIGECMEPPRVVAGAMFDCSAGEGTLAPPPKSLPCDVEGRYKVRVIAETDDGLVYANEGGVATLAPTAEGHSDIESPRGFIRLNWSVVGSDGTTPQSCPGNSVIPATLSDWRLDTRPCDPGSAVLDGVVPGTHDFDVSLEKLGGRVVYGTGHVTGATVTAGQMSDASVTITLDRP